MKAVWCTVAMVVLTWAIAGGTAMADTVGPDEVIWLDASGNTDDDCDSAVVLWNRSAQAGSVTIELLATNPDGNAPEGFLLLDGTMRVTTDLPEGEYRMLIVREYDREKRREKDLRQRSLRVMRRSAEKKRYRLARARGGAMCVSELGSPPRNALRRKEAGLLGQCGVDVDHTCVWAVVDTASDFAVGGQVPEPAVMACLIAGGVLILRRRRGR